MDESKPGFYVRNMRVKPDGSRGRDSTVAPYLQHFTEKSLALEQINYLKQEFPFLYKPLNGKPSSCILELVEVSGRIERNYELGSTVLLDKAAEISGVSRRTMYNWVNSGKVEYIKSGTSIRIIVNSLPPKK